MMPYSKQKVRAEPMLSDDFRRKLSVMTTAELLEVIDKQIEETQSMISLLMEEIRLRIMEQTEE